MDKTHESEKKNRPSFIAKLIAEHRKREWQQWVERNRKKVSVFHIQDCVDDNARTRLAARSSELLGPTESFVGAGSDLEAAGQLIDLLAALDGAVNAKRRKHQNVVLLNVAPRGGEGAKHENGTPFCYFRYQGTLVVATVDGYALSLLKKFGYINSVRVLDTRATLATLRKKGMISEDDETYVARTQFRSMEFSPRVALYLLRHGELPGTDLPLAEVKDAPKVVWLVDNFGNCKTTLTEADIAQNPGGGFALGGRRLKVYQALAEVPPGELALVVGSSGPVRGRFLELMLRGGSAAKELGLAVGSAIA